MTAQGFIWGEKTPKKKDKELMDLKNKTWLECNLSSRAS